MKDYREVHYINDSDTIEIFLEYLLKLKTFLDNCGYRDILLEYLEEDLNVIDDLLKEYINPYTQENLRDILQRLVNAGDYCSYVINNNLNELDDSIIEFIYNKRREVRNNKIKRLMK